jgi:MFS family permease
MTKKSGYLLVIKEPGAGRGVSAGTLARLAGGVVPFSTVAVFVGTYDSYVYAGIGTGILLLLGAVFAPSRGRLIDRYGGPALAGIAIVHLALLSSAAIFAGTAPAWTIVVLIGAGGAAGPPVGPAIRTWWSGRFPDKKRLQQMHVLDSVLGEAVFVVAPLTAAMLIVLLSAPLALAAGASLSFSAAMLMHRQILARVDHSTDTPGRVKRFTLSLAGREQRSLMLSREGQGIILPLVFLGVAGGGLLVLLTAASEGGQDFSSAAFQLALFSLGGVIGGLAYGKISWQLPLRTRYVYSGLILGGSYMGLSAAVDTPAAPVLVILVGIPMTPLFVISYMLVDEYISHRQTEANSWLGAAYNVGSAGGAAFSGWVVGVFSLHVASAFLAFLVTVGGFAGLRIPRGSSVSEAAVR